MTGVELMATAWLFGLAAVLAWHDVTEFRLPNLWTAILFGSGLLLTLLAWPDQLLDRVVGAAVGGLVFQAISAGYVRLRGRAGLGGGDVKLMVGAGIWVGWSGLALTVFVGCICALSTTVALAILRRRPLTADVRIPLGAYLALGVCFTWVMQHIDASIF